MMVARKMPRRWLCGTFSPGSKDELKPGVKVIVTATKAEDGSLQSNRMAYGRDGFTPM